MIFKMHVSRVENCWFKVFNRAWQWIVNTKTYLSLFFVFSACLFLSLVYDTFVIMQEVPREFYCISFIRAAMRYELLRNKINTFLMFNHVYSQIWTDFLICIFNEVFQEWENSYGDTFEIYFAYFPFLHESE